MAFGAAEFGVRAEAVRLTGWAEGIEILRLRARGGFSGFSARALEFALDLFDDGVVAGALGAVAGESGFVGRGRRRRGAGRRVPSGEGPGRRRGVVGIDVALLGRGLVDAEVVAVLERPDFVGGSGDVAEVVQVRGYRLQVTGLFSEVRGYRLSFQVTGYRLQVTGIFLGVRGGGGVGVGADESVVIETDAVDGLAERLVACEAGGAGEGIGGDLGGPDGGAGADGVEGMGEEAVDDLGHDELDGGVVFEQGDGDVVFVGEGGMAVVEVVVAEMEAIEGEAAAAVAVGFDGAAMGFGFGDWRCRGGWAGLLLSHICQRRADVGRPGRGWLGHRDLGTGIRGCSRGLGSFDGSRGGGGGHFVSFRALGVR